MSTPQEHQRFIDRAWYGPPRSEWRRRFRWVAYIAWYWTHLFSLLVASSLRQDADATLKKAGIAGIVSGSIFHFLLAVTFVAGSRLNHLLWLYPPITITALPPVILYLSSESVEDFRDKKGSLFPFCSFFLAWIIAPFLQIFFLLVTFIGAALTPLPLMYGDEECGDI
ncbi:hypothetical protein CC2G_009826 [Coprinopsis cinerea AmutBmut pab1-1]|nr:hypothetical protein CC2G_009826 [Coprinopsis cinerea AmutBmut pab1-1]